MASLVEISKPRFYESKFQITNFEISHSRDFQINVDPQYGNCYTFNGLLDAVKIAYREGRQHGKIIAKCVEICC